MKRTLRIIISFILLTGFSGLLFAQQRVAGESNGIKVSFTVQKDTVEVTMEAAVTGWIAIGINPSNMMKDADYKIAYVKDGVVYIRDDYGNGLVSHAEDTRLGGTSDILSYSGKEEKGYTSITFVIPRQTNDKNDRPLTPGNHKILVAASDSDNFTSKHKVRGSFVITLP
ncbi:MAG: DOMON domain-containing protein [Treponema sp.]|nr:DOMON domain-containing protein [Treponema sp.]